MQALIEGEGEDAQVREARLDTAGREREQTGARQDRPLSPFLFFFVCVCVCFVFCVCLFHY